MTHGSIARGCALLATVSSGVLALLAISIGPVQAQPTVSIAVVPRVVAVQAGEVFDVDVVMSTGLGVRTAQCGLAFDPALVEVVGVEEGPMLRDFARAQGGETLIIPTEPAIDNAVGTVEVVGISVMGMKVEGGAVGSGVFLTYHMRAKTGVQGTASLTLTSVVVGDALADQVPESDVAINPGQIGVGVAAESVPTGVPTMGVQVVPTWTVDAPAGVSPIAGAGAATVVPAALPVEPAEEEDSGLSTEQVIMIAGAAVVLVVVGVVVMRNR